MTPVFVQADDYARRKQLLATELPSSQLAKLDQDLKQRSVFSARLNAVGPLATLQRQFQLISAGTEDEHGRIRSVAEAKAQLKQAMVDAGIPLAPVGTRPIQDFYSDKRRSLMIETNVLDAMNFGRWKATQNQEALDVNPGWELVRVVVPKGGVEAERDWVGRWHDAMDAIGDAANEGCTDPDEDGGRMVALKNHPIWPALGDGAGGHDDSLGNPWPPFAFNSGMSVIDVPRAECIELALMSEDHQVQPDDSIDLNESLEANVEKFGEALSGALDGGGLQIIKGVLRLARNERLLRLLAAVNAYDPNQARGKDGRWVSGRALGNLYLRVKNGETIEGTKAYRDVTGPEADRIRRETGIDVHGFQHTVDQSALRHVIKTHGDATLENRRGLIAITQADLNNLPRTIARSHRITYLGTTNGMHRIQYEHMGNGVQTVIEEVRSGKKHLALVTMFKRKVRAANSEAEARFQTSETDRATNETLLQGRARFKTLAALCHGGLAS